MKEKQANELMGYAPRDIISTLNVLRTLKKNKITLGEFVPWAKAYKKERELMIERRELISQAGKVTISCPKCKMPLQLTTINIPKGKQNVRGWKSLIFCISCTYESYSRHSANKVLKKLLRKNKKSQQEVSNGNCV